MQPTRRYWGVAALGAVLAGCAVLFARPILLVGAAGVGAWLLAGQYRFVRLLAATAESLDVDQTPARDRVSVDEEVSIVLSASLAEPAPLDLTVEGAPPRAAAGDDRTDRRLDVDRGERGGETAYGLSIPVAGAFRFDPPTVSAVDPLGLVTESLDVGPAATLTVEPRAPRNVHVGEGGERIAAAYGEHPAGRLGTGLDPAELREYVPGDVAARIDWKATARLDRPYVREYEAETDRRTVLLIDGRATMGDGREGETKLDYARLVALGFAESARRLADPLGLYAVGDEGVTARLPPEATGEQYRRIRSRLHDLRPTADDSDGDTGGRSTARRPADVRRAAATLEDDDSPFGTTLRPFFGTAEPYVRRIGDDPLFGTVEAGLAGLRGTLWTVIITDDTRREELREAVKLARRGDDRVLVFLAPTVLFEPGGLSDVEAAYERYVDFEEFRRDLARLPRVTALEVAPGDRLGAVLDAGRRRGRPSARGGA